MLHADDICFYDDARVLLPPTTVRAGAGELVKVVGRNGAGKSALLKILCRLLPADGGVLRWNNQNAAEDAPAYCEDLLYVAHANGIAPELSPLENLRAAALLRLRPPRAPLGEALAQAGLDGEASRRCGALSAGQQRRAALARLRAFWAKLWLLDEPLAALDSAGRELLGKWLQSHLAGGGMAVVAMHHPNDWAIPAARVVECGGAATP